MDKHSPTPWRVAMNSLGWATRIADSNGHQIASCWGGGGDTVTEPAQSDAAYIVEAVNERDRLHDLVRRLEDEYEQLDEVDLVCNTDRAGRIEALFREALGEAQ